MPLGNDITFGIGGTIWIEPPTRPTNARCTIYQSDSAIISNNVSATVYAINTVLTNAVNSRARTIVVNNANAISEGDRFVISAPIEWVKAKTKTGNSITLWHPLRETHSNNSNVYSTRVSYAVNASEAAVLFWDGRVRWELDKDVFWSQCECTKYPLKRVANEQTLCAIHPQIASILEDSVDVEAALDAAHEHVLMLLGSRGRARTYPASTEFASATALALMRNHYRHQSSAVAKELFERYSNDLNQEMAGLLTAITPDEDQSGSIESDDTKNFNTFSIRRS